jgi:hypothetical protein
METRGGAMTLVVSVRVPDGIVVAADSLATLSMDTQAEAVGTVICPHCGQGHEVRLPVQLPPHLGAISTLPYALKLIPLYDEYAMSVFGSSMIGKKTVFSVVRSFCRIHKQPDSLTALNSALSQWLHTKIGETVDLSVLPDDQAYMGYQLSGYESEEQLTLVTTLGKSIGVGENRDSGVTINGEPAVVQKIWELGKTNSQMGSAYNVWSVLDAVDYAKFLISTTADFQKFAMMIPNVGGEIDIALLTPNRFDWIQKKPLADVLLQEQGGKSDEQRPQSTEA